MDVKDLYAKAIKITMKKRKDYTTNHLADNHENFKRSAELISWFKSDQDKAYVGLIGTKLARLASLLSDEREPMNESIEDSFIDLINYCGLWAERILSESKSKTFKKGNR